MDASADIIVYLRQCHAHQVFVRMVEAACRPGTPQCFMFTPKLLPNLPYTRDVYPMSILNGVHCSALTQEFQGAVRGFPPPLPVAMLSSQSSVSFGLFTVQIFLTNGYH